MTQPAKIADEPRHYERFGITSDIRPFEDGLRTDPSRSGHYEWWYFDAHLDNGAKLVVTFFTKDVATPATGLVPAIQIDLDLPDGTSLNRRVTFDPSEFSASTDSCDVRIGPNRFVGDLHEYRITAVVDDIAIDVALKGVTEPWRPATGHIVYGDDEEHYFAWLPSVPYGTVSATYRVGDAETATTGHGYHDHNWGNVSLLAVVNNWYWGRGQVGPYTFITAYIVSEKKYGYLPLTVFMLAQDGKVIADDGSRARFRRSGIHTDEITGKPVADVHGYRYENAGSIYDVQYTRDETILRTRFIDTVQGLKRLAARLAGFNGAYLRFRGSVAVSAVIDGQAVGPAEDTAVWELMYFGKESHER
jgi:hypothetical protein